MRRVRAVDHIIGWCIVGCCIYFADRRAQCLLARQTAIGLDGEGNHDRRGASLGGPRDANGFGRVGHGDRGDHVGTRAQHRADLFIMISFGNVRPHQLARDIAITPRADAARDKHRKITAGIGCAQVDHHRNRRCIGGLQFSLGIAQPVAPVTTGAPGRAFQDEAETRLLRDPNMPREIALERGAPAIVT